MPTCALNHADRVGSGGVRVVAVNTFHMPRHGERVFRRVVAAVREIDAVGRSFLDVRCDVERADRAIVAVQAVGFLAGETQQTFALRCGMDLVADRASIVADRSVLQPLPGINRPAGDAFAARGV